MYRCRNINRNARCIMSTCNTQLQLILLNSFVFLTSFVLLSGKGHFLMTDHRRKDPKFKFTPRKSSLVPVLTDPFCTVHSRRGFRTNSGLDWEAKRSTWKFSKGFKVLLFKYKWEISPWRGTEATGNGRVNDRHKITRQVCACMLTAVSRARFLAGSHLCYFKNNPHLSSKKPQPINQSTFIAKQIWAVETQLLCSVKRIFSKSQKHKLNFTHHLSLLNLLTPGLGPWMLPHSQTMALWLSRPCAAPVQLRPSHNKQELWVLFYRDFNFKQRDFWRCFFPHFLYRDNRTQDVEFQDIT